MQPEPHWESKETVDRQTAARPPTHQTQTRHREATGPNATISLPFCVATMNEKDEEKAEEKPRVISLSLGVGKKKKKSSSSSQNADVVRQQFAEPVSARSSPDDNHHDQAQPKAPLVIPAVPNSFGIAAPKKVVATTTPLSEADEQAIRALQGQAQEISAASNHQPRDIVIQASKDTFQRESQQFKADLQDLPDALDSEEYTRSVPIADFGAAMLRGMGWKEPEATTNKGKKNNDDEVMPRPHRLGLGAIPKMEDPNHLTSHHKKRPLRPDQIKQRARLEEQQKEFAAERARQIALDKQRTLQNGSLVRLRSSSHGTRGGRAQIVQLVGVPGLNMVKVWKEHDAQTSIVKRADIEQLLSREELESRPYHHHTSKHEPSSTRGNRDETMEDRRKRERTTEKRRRREEDTDHDRRNGGTSSHVSSKRPRGDESSPRRLPTWVIPNIRVRVVTEKLGKKYFKEKGIIVDVTSKGATLRLDKTGKVLDRVREDYLETALPKPGGKAIVLAGRHKYAKGKLLERDSKRAKGAIQIFEDMSVLNLSLDDMAEFVGSLDDDLE